MKIELAENYGFCFGVKRAIKIAEENKNASTYGPLIHNSKEIARLDKDFKVGLVEDFKTFKEGDRAIVRTHGIVKEELAELGKVLLQYPDVTVITDDIYEHILWDENKPFVNILMACPCLPC